MRSRLLGAAAYAILLAILLPWFGGQGAAIAAIIGSSLIFIQLARATARVLRRTRVEPIIGDSRLSEQTPV